MPELPDAGSEDETERDGAFSYASEWHAFFLGIGIGMATVMPVPYFRRFVWLATGLAETDPGRTEAIREIQKESWYAVGGAVLGILLLLYLYLALLAIVFL